jgi:hypothetical protein
MRFLDVVSVVSLYTLGESVSIRNVVRFSAVWLSFLACLCFSVLVFGSWAFPLQSICYHF